MMKFIQNLRKDKIVYYLMMAKLMAFVAAIFYFFIDPAFKPLFWVPVAYIVRAILYYSIKRLRSSESLIK